MGRYIDSRTPHRMVLSWPLGAALFGVLVFASIAICERISPPNDRAGTLAAEGLRVLLTAAATVIGGGLFIHREPPEIIVAAGILCCALGATCYLVSLDGKIPIVPVAVALAIADGSGLLNGDSGPLVSSLVTGTPFAISGYMGRTKGADWRDALVAGLSGAAFGLQQGIVVIALGCVVIAVMRPYLARHRTLPQPPPRFASAVSATIILFLLGKLTFF